MREGGPLDDAKLWHDDCELYEVAKDDVVVGHVALDLKSRDGKFGHQMVVPLRPALVDGQPNCCAVLGNMGDANGRLRFREVETLLHELGHVFHALAGGPYLLFKIPLLETLLTNARPTGYDAFGHTLPKKERKGDAHSHTD